MWALWSKRLGNWGGIVKKIPVLIILLYGQRDEMNIDENVDAWKRGRLMR